MSKQAAELGVPQRKLDERDKRQRYNFTGPPGLKSRLEALVASTGLPESRIIERALVRALPIFEADTREIMKDADLPSPTTNTQEGE